MATEPGRRGGSHGRRPAHPNMADRTQFFCPFCPLRTFKYFHAVHDHFAQKHRETYCSICSFDFGNAYQLIRHFQWHNGHGSQPAVIFSNSSATTQASHASQASQVSPASQLSAQQLPIQYNHPASIPRDYTPSATSKVSRLPPQKLPIQYTQLTPQEHELTLQELLTRCHSPTRLRRQNFTMPGLADALGQNTMLPENGVDRTGLVESGDATGAHRDRGQSGSNEGSPPKRPKKRHALPPELFKCTPQRQQAEGPPKRKAVALDCEMVEIRTSNSELAYLSAVDFLTGEVLIDSFVVPTGTVVCWRTRTSGISASNMAEAVRSGKALHGWTAARDKLWEFVDDQTVLIGHALQNDLQVLGIFHPWIVDSSIVTAGAVFNNTTQPDQRFPRVWGLRKLAKALLNRDIQQSDKGHSALEDAYAARDIVLCAIQSPNVLAQWTLVARAEEERRQQERKRMIEAMKRKRAEALQKQIEERALQTQAQVAVSTTFPVNPNPGPTNSSYGRVNFTNGPENLNYVPHSQSQSMYFHEANRPSPSNCYIPTGPHQPMYFYEAIRAFPSRHNGPPNQPPPTFFHGGYSVFPSNR